MEFYTTNPANGEILHKYSYFKENEIEKVLGDAAFNANRIRTNTLESRILKIEKFADVLIRYKNELSNSIATEMGKPILQARAEVEKSASACRYYTQKAIEYLTFQTVEMENTTQSAKIYHEPIGVLLVVMPWNFPLWQLIRAAVPALLVGNVVLHKPADITTGTADLIEKIFSEAFDDIKSFFNLRISHEQASAVISDHRVRAVSFTGSTQGGRQIAELCGKNLKKSILELGGNDAYIILEDAEIQRSAKLCVETRMVNTGQSCVAGKRFFVHENVLQNFLDEYLNVLNSYAIGSPLDEGNSLGPLAARRLRQNIIQQIKTIEELINKNKIGQIINSSIKIPENGFYFQPKIVFLESIESLKDSKTFHLFDMELFGPVATIVSIKKENEALEIINQGQYGLGGGIFTQDSKRAEQVMKQMQCGLFAINDYVKSDPKLPFGGVKNSGYGRELGSAGIYEFCNIKSVVTTGLV